MKLRPGHDGNPPIVELVRDPDGKGRREIVRQARYDAIGWLLKNKRIEPYQEAAARMLQDDAERAQIVNYTRSEISKVGGRAGILVLSDKKLEALERHADAIASVRSAFDKLGSAGERLVTLIVIEGHALGKAANVMKVPQRQILLALRVALDALARHYRLG